MARRDIKEARKDNIIESALQIFAEKGYTDATMTDIAKKAGVSTPVLYGYFKTKEDLLFTIPEKLSEEPVRTMDLALPYFRRAEEKIRMIVQGYLSLYENNPLYASLVMLELKTNRNFLKTKAYITIQKVARTLLESIREGISDGTFKEDTDALLVRSMILGTIEHICINKILLGEPKNLEVYIDPLVDTILDGIKKQSKQVSINLSIHNLEMSDNTEGNSEKKLRKKPLKTD
ncbi:MAG: TetR/AcrR family transcriptional regulator [Deltaproteobacteria bacterium]|nr:TetR/AcrR family transcriptional regulator [Deltaproteobacteria bacterium]